MLLQKLGRLMDESAEDPEAQVRADLMSSKLKNQQKIWKAGSLLSGEVQQPHAEGIVDFKIDGDMVHVKVKETSMETIPKHDPLQHTHDPIHA